MQILINIDQLTPKQAYELGLLMREQSQPTKLEVVKNNPVIKTRKKRGPNTGVTRFKKGTNAPIQTVELGVTLRKKGLTFQQIADEFNDRGIPTLANKPWVEGTVWNIVYSTQAWSFWKAA